MSKDKKRVVVFYSYTGNTKKIAENLASKLGADMLEIETVKKYSSDYDEVVEHAKKEIRESYKPEIKPLKADVSNYDEIILGTPVWWYSMAPAVLSFLANYDLSGKVVYPFATNGGWIGHTFEDIKKACTNSTVEKGIDIYFFGSNLKTPSIKIDEWLQNIK